MNKTITLLLASVLSTSCLVLNPGPPQVVVGSGTGTTSADPNVPGNWIGSSYGTNYVAAINAFTGCGNFQLCSAYPGLSLSGNEYFADSDLGSDGNLYFVGTTTSSITETKNPTTNTDIFLFSSGAGNSYKVSSFGENTFPQEIGNGNETPLSLSVSADSETIWIGGYSKGSSLTPASRNPDIEYATIFIATKNLNLSSVSVLPTSATSATSASCLKIVATSEGGAVCTGLANASYFGDPGTARYAFLWKVDIEGKTEWIRKFPYSFYVESDTAEGTDGSIYMVSTTNEAIVEPLPDGSRNGYIVKVDKTTGSTIWQRQWGTTSYPSLSSGTTSTFEDIRIDGSGNIFVGGYVQNVGLFEAQRNYSDRIVVRYSLAGNVIWGAQLGSVSMPSSTYPGSFFFPVSFDLSPSGPVIIMNDSDGSSVNMTQFAFDAGTGALTASPSNVPYFASVKVKRLGANYVILRNVSGSVYGPGGGGTDATFTLNSP